MIRILLDRAFDNEHHYIHAVGLSTDTKPTTGIITGSKFVAVDTGAGYLFDETAGEWNENTQLSEAVAAYLDEHPEALDQAAIEAMFGDQLDGIEEDLSGLKSAINDIETDIEEVYTGKLIHVESTANKLNPDEIKANTIISNSGAESEDSRYYSSGFIPVDTSKSNVAFTGVNAAGTARVCLPTSRIVFYDGTKTYLSRVDGTSTNTITEVPSGASFVRISWSVNYNARQLMVEFVDAIGDISATFVQYEEVSEYSHGINYLDETQQSILGRLDDVEDDLEDLSSLPDQVETNTDKIADITGASRDISHLATFEHGYINSTGAYVNTYNYRIATPNYVNIQKTIIITIATGFRVYLAYYDENNTTISVGWVTGTQTIEAGSRIRMTIARVTEDASETADIDTFCSKATYIIKESVDYLAEKVRNIDSMIPYGCTWDWWIGAQSIDTFGNVYIGYIDTDGYHGVMKRQPDGTMQYKRLEAAENDDDHNGTATIILPDGRILAIGAYGHSKNNHIVCWKSAEPYSIDNMTKYSFDIPQETNGWKYACTYSQVFQYNGVLYDFMRCVCTKTGEDTVVGYICIVSSDSGETWTAYKAIVGSDPYISFAQTSNDSKIITGIYAYNPGTRPVGMFRGFRFDMSTQKFYDLEGTQIGALVALNSGSIADEGCAVFTDMTELISQGSANASGRLLFAASTESTKAGFVYAIADNSSSTSFTYYRYYDGTSLEIGNSGVPFGSTTYISGACFGKDINTIYYIKATTSKADGAHEVHRVTINNGTVANDEIITESAVCMIRPLFLGQGELALSVGHYNDQNSNGTYNGSYTAWELKPLFTHA